MKTSYVLFLTLLTVSGIVLPLGAEVVNDGATRTLSNATNAFPGDVTVGTNGSFTLLIISDNALRTSLANGVIGRLCFQRASIMHSPARNDGRLHTTTAAIHL